MKTIDAIAITPVASQPITDHAREIVKSPSIFFKSVDKPGIQFPPPISCDSQYAATRGRES
jgi:hypothetical protein